MIRKSRGRNLQVDFFLCRQYNLKEIGECKIGTGECEARQHQIVMCRMTLMVRKRAKAEQRIKWLKLEKENCCEEIRL